MVNSKLLLLATLGAQPRKGSLSYHYPTITRMEGEGSDLSWPSACLLVLLVGG